MTKQVITRNGAVVCVTSVPYPAFIIKSMKQAGYKITVVNGDDKK